MKATILWEDYLLTPGLELFDVLGFGEPPLALNNPTGSDILQVISLDSGVAGSAWTPAEFSWLGYWVFGYDLWTLRYDFSNSPTPAFSGGVITFADFRLLPQQSGRYAHLEIVVPSLNYLLSPGWIGCVPAIVPPVIPPAPVVSNFVRAGASGSCDITGVDPASEVFAWGLDILLPGQPQTQVGYQVGDGPMVLDFSHFYALGMPLGCPLIFQVHDPVSGEWSETASFHGNYFLGLVTSIVISNYVRLQTSASFDVTGITPGDVWLLIATGPDGVNVGTQVTADGPVTFTGLDPLWRYVFQPFGLLATGTLTVPLLGAGFGDLISWNPSTYINDEIAQFICQEVTFDLQFMSLTGANPADPRLYFKHPMPEIECDAARPGWATYFLEGTGDKSDDVMIPVSRPDRTYRLDVWGRTQDDVHKIYDRVEEIFTARYYFETTNFRFKQIRPLGVGVDGFDAATRLFHKSGLFDVKWIVRKTI